MLDRLRTLPWRRVDVCFKGTPTPFMAHNHIQVRRPPMSLPAALSQVEYKQQCCAPGPSIAHSEHVSVG